MNYKIKTRDFLIRARKRLNENTAESLIYAALELRLGIEARLQKYMDVIEELPIKRKKGWRIADLDKNLENIFKKGNRIVEILIIDEVTSKLLAVFYYTPVSKELVKKGEKIGELLHAKKIYQTQKEDWFSTTKQFLEEVYIELVNANKGTLLGPPLYNPALRRFDMALEYFDGYNPADIMERIGGVGKKFIMNIDYPKEYPE